MTYNFDYGTFKVQKQDKGVNDMKRKLRLKEKYQNILIVFLFYLLIIVGIVLINFRLEQLGMVIK